MSDERHAPAAELSSLLAQADQLRQGGEAEQAEAIYGRVLHAAPTPAQAVHALQQIGVLRLQRNDYQGAAACWQQAVALDGHNPVLWSNLALARQKQGRLAEAIELYGQALAIRADLPAAHYNLANLLSQQGRLAEAVVHYAAALQLNPANAMAHFNLGNARLRLGEPEAAASAYRDALQVQPALVQAYNNLAIALRQQGLEQAALQACCDGLALDPDHGDLLLSLADLLQNSGNVSDAAVYLQRALTHDPQNGELLLRLGQCYRALGRTTDALISFDQALQHYPEFAAVHNEVGATYLDAQQPALAIPHLQQAVRCDARLESAHANLALAYKSLGDVSAAQAAFGRVAELRPQDRLLPLHAQSAMPVIAASNAEIDQRRAELAEKLDRLLDENIALNLADLPWSVPIPPFELAYQGRDDLPLKQRFARLLSRGVRTRTPDLPAGKPHVGFVVTDGHEAVFLKCMGALVNRFPTTRFRVTLVCGHRADQEKLRAVVTNTAVEILRLAPHFEQSLLQLEEARFSLLHFWEVGSDATNYFLPMHRLAPIQSTTWGWPVTSGLSQMDFFVSSGLLETTESDSHYSERLIRLAHLPTYYLRPPTMSNAPTRSQYGLPEQATLYFCSQNLRKVHPDFDQLVAEILRQDRNGQLLLIEDLYPEITQRLRQRFQATLPDLLPRVRFLPRLSEAEFRDLNHLADVVLDTVHYGGGANTTYDAVAMGAPVVTWPGRFQRGRFAAGAYQQMGVNDFVAHTAQEYVAKALRLGADAAYRIQARLEIREASSALFETEAAIDELADFFDEAIQL